MSLERETGPRAPDAAMPRGRATRSRIVPQGASVPPLPSEPTRPSPSELPYPEGPLASRRAEDEQHPETECQTSTVGEHLAEARAIEDWQERKHALRDPKPPPRYIDPEVLRAFHDAGPSCLSCGYYSAHAHHLISRAQGGDDALANLLPLCGLCHGCLHSGGKAQAYGVTTSSEQVRFRIGHFLTSEAGEDHLAYVKAKLGVGAGVFLERYGVEL